MRDVHVFVLHSNQSASKVKGKDVTLRARFPTSPKWCIMLEEEVITLRHHKLLIFLALLVAPLFLAGCGNQSPTATFIASPSSGPAPLTVSFDASGSSDPDGYIVSFSWNFGDGTQGTGEFIVHTYENPGTYTVTLTVTDDAGAKDTASRTIHASQAPLQILTWYLDKDGYWACVKGQAKNVSGRMLDYAEVRAYFYNAADERIGEWFDNTIDLPNGTVWNFEICYFGDKDEVAYAQVAVGTCY